MKKNIKFAFGYKSVVKGYEEDKDNMHNIRQ